MMTNPETLIYRIRQALMPFLLSLYFIAALPTAAMAQTTPPEELKASATQFSNRLSGGYEEETQRRYISVQLEQDGPKQPIPGYMVLYTITGHAGTEAFHNWAALFLKKSPGTDTGSAIYTVGQYVVSQLSLIGNSGWRSVDIDRASLNGNAVNVPYKAWRENDKVCCPSRSGTGRITYSLDKIVFLE